MKTGSEAEKNLKFNPATMSSEKSLEIVGALRTNGALSARRSQAVVTHRPPKPRLALTIGVTGHRLHRNPPPAGAASGRIFDVKAVEDALGRFFRAAVADFAAVSGPMGDLFDRKAPTFTLISSLAEGADRLAARAALTEGFALDVVLPCPSKVYLGTFADDASRGEFDVLLASARSRLVLPLAGRFEQSIEERLPRS